REPVNLVRHGIREIQFISRRRGDALRVVMASAKRRETPVCGNFVNGFIAEIAYVNITGRINRNALGTAEPRTDGGHRAVGCDLDDGRLPSIGDVNVPGRIEG